MKNKTLTILLAVLMSMTASVASAHDFEVDGIYYNVTSSANPLTVEVTYRGSSSYEYSEEYSGEVVIPESVTYDDIVYNVTSIGNNAFSECKTLTNVSIPESVYSIGKDAFYSCSGLLFVNIPTHVSTIEESVFCACSSLTSITIPNGVYHVKANAFNGCSSLTTLFIPASVTVIEYSSFVACPSLTSIIVDPDNTFYDSRDGCNAIIETSLNQLVVGCQNTIIPNTVTSIGKTAFWHNSNLTSIAIPNSVTSIGYMAFCWSSLTSISIPGSVISIGLEAFSNCRSMTTVNIEDGVKYIGEGAFYSCRALTSMSLPCSIVSIGEDAFAGCDNLNTIFIPESVTSIGSTAFGGCKSLTSIAIPKNVESVGSSVFRGCTGLTDIFCYLENVLAIDDNVFNNVDIANATLHVRASALSDYKTTEPWSGFGTIEAFPENINLQDGNIFSNLYGIDVEEVAYTRTFSNTNWQALYLPFEMEYVDWKDNFDVARINDTHQWDDNDDGVIDRTELEVIKIRSGQTEAHTPYLIRAKSKGEKTITVTDATLYAAEERSIDCSSLGTLYTFTGTYTGVPGETMLGNGYYAFGGGSLHQAADATNALSPFRWYMAITDRQGNPKNLGEVKVLVFDMEEETDGVEVIQNSKSKIQNYFDLSGRRVTNPRQGIYVKNGRKVVIQ